MKECQRNLLKLSSWPRARNGKKTIDYETAVEEALCFGWIDSLVKSIDDERFARKFTPRKPGSRWSTINRRRYADLKQRGLLTAAGLERPPTERSGDAPRLPVSQTLPPYLKNELKQNPEAWKYFAQLAPSYQRAYIGWIASAKREETKMKRIAETVALLARGQKLGLK
jgi:uncharacterized protein YdeI (YjbR/CyaY-like superfamily)